MAFFHATHAVLGEIANKNSKFRNRFLNYLFNDTKPLYIGEKENGEAFEKHMEKEVDLYRQVAVINLVDQTGKEKVMADSFLQYALSYNCPGLTYVAFDFHEYCRGMRFENVNILIETIYDLIKEMRYCWVDPSGMICDQRGVFRVNCIDCLDRTNIVQSGIARMVLVIQCRKLGLLPPDEELPRSSRLLYQQMWANNGDAISRQYAGTAALKGDYTRTGERRFTGMMKDGMNSANRYYINKVKDAYRQTAVDLMLGHAILEDMRALNNTKALPQEEEEAGLVEKEENMKTLIDECKKMLITEPEQCLGGWGLIDCDHSSGDPNQQDMDIILLLSQRACYVVNYDDESDHMTSYQKIYLEDLEKIEIGTVSGLFRSKGVCMRIHYQHHEGSSFFHAFRTTSTRLFNNIVIEIKNEEEAKESLKAIYESIAAVRKMMSQDLPIIECKLDRRKSKPHPGVIDIASQVQEKVHTLTKPGLTPVSSDNDIKSPDKSLSLPVPGATNLKMSGIRRTLLGPVKNIRFGGFRSKMPAFVPSVWYSRNDVDNAVQSSTNSLERATILGDDNAPLDVQGSPPNKDKLRTVRKYSLDDVDADLAARSDKVLAATSDDDVSFHSCRLVDSTCRQNSVPILDTEQTSDLLADQFDQLDEDLRNTDQPNRSNKKLHRRRSRSLDRESPRTSLTDNEPDGQERNFLIGCSKDEYVDCINCLCANKSDIPGSGSNVLSDDLTQASNTTWFTSTSPDCANNSTTDETWVDIKVDTIADSPSQGSVQLYHPCMKMSFSEGSIAAAFQPDIEQMTISASDLQQASAGPAGASALARLRVKMSGLALPTMPSGESKRKQALVTAKQHRLRSEAEYQDSKTRIILL